MGNFEQRFAALEQWAVDHGYTAPAVTSGLAPVVRTSSQYAQAQAWLQLSSNVVTVDPTGAPVIAEFRLRFPSIAITGLQVSPVAASMPGGAPTGEYQVALSISEFAPGFLNPAPPPQPVANPDGTGVPGTLIGAPGLPPGIDTATAEATPVNGTVQGSDGQTYVKFANQELMGMAYFWKVQGT